MTITRVHQDRGLKENTMKRDETLREVYAIVRGLVDAMVEWGSWEDGVPDFGSVGEAFDRGVAWLKDVEAHFGWPAGGPTEQGGDEG